MSSLSRHKKPGGFENLVHFLETTPQDKREKLMATMSDEDPAFMDRVSKSLLQFTDLKSIRDEVLMEVIHALGTNIRVLALALYKLEDQAYVDKFKKCLTAKQMSEFREAEAELDKVSRSQREGAQLKIVETTRKLDLARNLRIKPYFNS